MARTFNTTGPCNPDRHYMLPAEARMPDLLRLVEEQLYFVVHAARQTGKTTAMRAFAARLRALGYVALWATLEASQGVQDVARAEAIWVAAIRDAASRQLPPARIPTDVNGAAEGTRFGALLTGWARAVEAPIVLLLDEADVVTGDPLVSLLRQLRAGFMDRGPGAFPVSVALIGMRDLRDYLATAKDGRPVSAGSPFNVKSESITLRNFTRDEVATLLAQHTDDTGQAFTEEAVGEVFRLTQGQPFLVNWLARKCVRDLVTDLAVEVAIDDIGRAKEEMILARTTHLDSLSERLKEPRVIRIVQPVLLGDGYVDTSGDDFVYCQDLGLVRRTPAGIEVANPIYREVVARVLSGVVQDNVAPAWWPWSTADGGLNFDALVDAFLQWWRENADMLAGAPGVSTYPEAVPQLAFMGFLQRVVNGGGRITREFAAGRGRIDLLVEYGPDKFVVELKRVTQRDSLDSVKARGLEQIRGYMETVAAQLGWLIVFDVRDGRTWDERLWREEVAVGGRFVRSRGA